MSDSDCPWGNMSERLIPPEGFESWLAYAIETMDTSSLFDQQFCDNPRWPPGIQRLDMREAAEAELTELREYADAMAVQHEEACGQYTGHTCKECIADNCKAKAYRARYPEETR